MILDTYVAFDKLEIRIRIGKSTPFNTSPYRELEECRTSPPPLICIPRGLFTHKAIAKNHTVIRKGGACVRSVVTRELRTHACLKKFQLRKAAAKICVIAEEN